MYKVLSGLILLVASSVWGPAVASAVQLLDQEGHPLFLAGPAQHLASHGVSMTTLILLLGGQQQLVATSSEVKANPWLGQIFPSLATIATPFNGGTGNVDMETLLARKPDLVVIWTGNSALRQQLTRLGIPSLTLGYSTPAELTAAIRLLANAMGPEARQIAANYLDYYQGNIALLQRQLGNVAAQDKPKIYYSASSPLETEGRQTLVDSWIQVAGGQNVAGGISGSQRIALETLMTWDPDIIIVRDKQNLAAFTQDPRLARLRAVRTGRLYVNPRGLNVWSTRAGETALQLLWAARCFYPQRFASIDIRRETTWFYNTFYHYSLSARELDRLLAGDPP